MSARRKADRVLYESGSFRALETALWRELDGVRAREPLAPVVVLVPTNLLRRHLAAEGAARSAAGWINVHFLTLLDLARELGEAPLAAAGRSPLPPLAGELVARAACRAVPNSYFAAIADRPGFHRALLATIADLKEAGHTQADLGRCLAEKGRFSAVLPKLRDLAALWRAYEERLGALALYDPADLLAAAAAAAPADRWLAQAAGVFVYGFYDLNGLQRRLVAAATQGRLARVFFPYSADCAAFRYAAGTREWFLAQGFEPRAEPEPGQPAELAALHARLFHAPMGLCGTAGSSSSGERLCGTAGLSSSARHGGLTAGQASRATPERLCGTGGSSSSACHGELTAGQASRATPEGAPQAVRIVSAPDEVREVQAIIRAALAAAGGTTPLPLREGEGEGLGARPNLELPPSPCPLPGRERGPGTPLPRVGILLRQAGTYAPLFAEACAAGGLDAYHHTPQPLAATRAGRSLLMLLRLIGSDLARPDVMEFLTYADLPLDGAATADWDLLSLLAGVVKGRESWRSRLGALRKSLRDDAEERPERAAELLPALDSLVAFLAEFFSALEGVPAQGTWAELAGAVAGAFRRFVRPSAEREAVAEAAAGLSALDATGEPADVPTLARFAREALDSAGTPRPPFGSRGPVVVDLMQGRGLPFDLACVPGLVEKGFPALPAQDPLLSDAERKALCDAGLALPLKGARAEEERLLFRLAVGAASQSVLLTYPRLEPASGRERVPSHFLLRALEAVTGCRCDYAALASSPHVESIPASAFAPAEPADAWCEAEYDLSAALAALKAKRAAELGYLAALSPTFPSALRAEASRWGERAFTPYDGVLKAKAALAALRDLLGPAPWRMPPTALERYAACPFRYFLTHILDVEPLEEPEAIRRLSGLDRGRLLHRILCRVLREARDERRLPLRADAEEHVLEAARGHFAEFEKLGLVGIAALWSLERAAIERDLRRFVADEAADTSYIPAHFEVAFGAPPRDDAELGSDEGLVIALGDAGSVRIVGRIDRIDLTPDGTHGRVVDYKTGSKGGAPGANSFEGGTALQLPLYLKAAELILQGVTMDDARYRYVTERGEYKAIGFDSATCAERESELMLILRTIVEGVATGRFFAGASATEACKRCDHYAICGRAAEATARRKLDDAAAKPYLDLQDVP
ncbi:MAG: hypothetical protein FJ290_23000 [Planctomycetes bacterium]|nr:hypothetical protein [Planctomycetota bacterium]